MRTIIGALLMCSACWAQSADECKPSSLNIPGAPYPCIHADRRVTFRIQAPDAQKVQVRLSGAHDMTKGADGLWMVTIPPQVVGFHYYTIVVDGAAVADPATRTFFGSGWANSGIEIPESEADAAYYAPKDVPHGQVSQRWYFSKVTGAWRRCYVYTPPEYDANSRTRYPVLYLLHGWGENEQGWSTQGHVDFIMDNLLAAKKAKPMLVVMDNLNAVKPGADASLYAARGVITKASMADVAPSGGGRGAPGAGRGGFPSNWGGVFTDMMFTDLVPMVERTYRVLPGRENRAMAGLSMGGMQSFLTVLGNLDKFAYLGGFSGSSGGRGGFDPKTADNGVYADPAAFNKKMKLLFLGIGSVEGPGTKTFSEALAKAGIHNVYFESPGTAHEWLTWRRCLNDFAPRLFK
ncbi:MAG TPA: alpha/beta hydrolase-fold protein [Candidatus Sulfopaludibacter sp.]|jgi:enterochelin esterase family protein|nr:alpha/beta hydrolase-fold protein [Candidatus Sulfopaludibacter sp.]